MQKYLSNAFYVIDSPHPAQADRVFYLASEVDADIAKLKEALRFYADAKDFYVWDRDGKYHDNGNEIARIALGL